MVGFVACHDCFFEDGQVADLARVIALTADGVPIGQQQDVVTICTDSFVTFCASETVDVPELRCEMDDSCVRRILIDDEPAASARDVNKVICVEAREVLVC